jgi:hypothetical protein
MGSRIGLSVGITWTCILTIVSLLPESIKGHIALTGTLHLASHVAAFAISAILLTRSFPATKDKILCVLALIAVGVAIEITQWRWHRHTLEYTDILFDLLGISFGMAPWFNSDAVLPSGRRPH